MSYTLASIADAYNDLLDLKAYTEVLGRSDFPRRLLSVPAVALGTFLVDVNADGRVAACKIEAAGPRNGAPPPRAFMWINLERPDHASPLHSNVLVWNDGVVRRFEPHGADPSLPEHEACGFQGYYSPRALDAAIAAALAEAGLLPPAPGAGYVGVDPAFPVLGQSLSTNDSPLNAAPGVPGRAFKRVGKVDGTGDNFCGAWTGAASPRAPCPVARAPLRHPSRSPVLDARTGPIRHLARCGPRRLVRRRGAWRSCWCPPGCGRHRRVRDARTRRVRRRHFVHAGGRRVGRTGVLENEERLTVPLTQSQSSHNT